MIIGREKEQRELLGLTSSAFNTQELPKERCVSN